MTASPTLPDRDTARDLRRRLLAWYDRTRRDLPWRRSPSPYRTWVSEVMLQQTRVEAVLEPYARFLKRFPDLESLAAADLDAVLAAWSGLGYYRRARLLHRGARHVVGDLGGALPRERKALEAVPGIGSYTAGAVLSIAFGLPEPLVDGNVERVLTRLLLLEGNPRKGALKKHLWRVAGRLVPRGRPGDWNQALMELGATVCKPRNPACGECPLATRCEARAAGRQLELPELPPRKPPVPVRMAAALVRSGGRFLLLRRPRDASLMAGMWELPTVELEPGADARPALAEVVREATGAEVDLGPCVARVRHGILDRRITLEGHEATGEVAIADEDPDALALVAPEELSGYGVSSMVSKLLRAATEGDRQGVLPL